MSNQDQERRELATIYIVQDNGNINFRPAQVFGEKLVAVSKRDIPIYADPEIHEAEIAANLLKFNPIVDYLILVGDPVNILLAGHILLKKHKGFDCLKWDRQNRDYFEVHLGVKGYEHMI